jgi:hypothetical protein
MEGDHAKEHYAIGHGSGDCSWNGDCWAQRDRGTPLNMAQTLVIRDKPLLSETDAQVSDRERLQLRRHFSQERRDWILR